MKVLLINIVCGIRSTGRICTDLAEELEQQGHTVKIAYGREQVPEKYEKYAVKIGNKADVLLHAAKARFLDTAGFESKASTRRFLLWAEKYNPDLLWLHNLHGYYIDVAQLFRWIKSRPGMKVKWTLHDCWAFTGHCAHYMVSGCEKWKNGSCDHCPEKRQYPASVWLDRSRTNYQRKKELFQNIPHMELITPSRWLAGEVKKSFLKEYPVTVVNNTIDTEAFQPSEGDFRKKHGLEGQKLILGVASSWTKRKGLEDFLKLSGKLSSEYTIILVGLTEKQIEYIRRIEQTRQTEGPKQTNQIKRNTGRSDGIENHVTKEGAAILGIERTNSKQELAQIYTTADVFLNLTYEENYPTVNLEAEACGTPVITYDAGGCRETVQREDSKVVPVGDLKAVIKLIRELAAY